MTATRLRRARPTPECLLPQEIEQFVASKLLPDARQRHVDACTWCDALLRGTQPDPRGKAAFVKAAVAWADAWADAPTATPAPARVRSHTQGRHRIDA